MKKPLLLLLFVLGSTGLFSQNHIHSVFFGGGSYYIGPSQVEEIKQFLEGIPHIEHYQITVSSHTDNIGGVEYNAWLSKMRSSETMHKLESLDMLPMDRVNVVNNGQLNPLYDNRSHNGRLANRRVDIILEPLVM